MVALSRTSIQMVWERYAKAGKSRGAGAVEDRNRLIEHYLFLVRRQAELLAKRLPMHTRADDLISDGVIGLMAAIEAFDPAKAVPFGVYAPRRVRGAMLDGIRDRDPVPRLARARATRIHAARERLRARGIMLPTADEMIRESGLSSSEVRKAINKPTVPAMSLQDRLDGDGRNPVFAARLADRRAPDPVDTLCRREFWRGMTRGLNRDQRACLVMYWRDGLRLAEIGRALDLSESRCSQILAEVMKILKSQMAPAECLEP